MAIGRLVPLLLGALSCLVGAGCGDQDPTTERVASEARAYRKQLEPGERIGWVRLPGAARGVAIRAGLDQATIDRGGAGWYGRGRLPGEGGLVYLAGHRRTHGAPFRRVGELRRGDGIEVAVPYARAVYAVTDRSVVSRRKLSVLSRHDGEQLRLQASTIPASSRRVIVTADLVKLRPRR